MPHPRTAPATDAASAVRRETVSNCGGPWSSALTHAPFPRAKRARDLVRNGPAAARRAPERSAAARAEQLRVKGARTASIGPNRGCPGRNKDGGICRRAGLSVLACICSRKPALRVCLLLRRRQEGNSEARRVTAVPSRARARSSMDRAFLYYGRSPQLHGALGAVASLRGFEAPKLSDASVPGQTRGSLLPRSLMRAGGGPGPAGAPTAVPASAERCVR